MSDKERRGSNGERVKNRNSRRYHEDDDGTICHFYQTDYAPEPTNRQSRWDAEVDEAQYGRQMKERKEGINNCQFRRKQENHLLVDRGGGGGRIP